MDCIHYTSLLYASIFHGINQQIAVSHKITELVSLSTAFIVGNIYYYLTSSSLSYRVADMRNRPSSNCISRFSNRLFKTGRTFRSAFSIPSRIRIRPLVAARTAHYQVDINKIILHIPPTLLIIYIQYGINPEIILHLRFVTFEEFSEEERRDTFYALWATERATVLT